MISSRCFSLALSVLLAIATLGGPTSFAQRNKTAGEFHQASAAPADYCIARHDVGRLVFGITNFGMVGIGEGRGVVIDCYSGTRVRLGEYPKGDNNTYFYKGGLWVGAVAGKDTLVSTGADFNNSSREFHPLTNLIRRSTLDPLSPEFEDAVSELDYVAVYADTFVRGVPNLSFDFLDNRLHKPIGLEVTQSSYSWSYAHTNDFVLIEYKVRNITDRQLDNVFLGVYWDIDVHTGERPVGTSPDPYGRKSNPGGRDDMTGFIFRDSVSFRGCPFFDTMMVAWTADNDGNPDAGGNLTLPHISGLRLLGSLPNTIQVSYNWWTYNYSSLYDFGPQKRADFRNLGNGSGTPFGDRNKYHVMRQGEVDYDQAQTGLVVGGAGIWSAPSARQAIQARSGMDNQFLLSIGPYSLGPGSDVTVPVAFVAGENFHQDPSNHRINLYNLNDPEAYYAGANFEDFLRNAATAGRVYDIPGFDTDLDGYAGKFRVCVLDSVEEGGSYVPTAAETTYYEGDGIPDWKAAAPPPPPEVRVHPIYNGFRVRFNGHRSETSEDIFSQKIDFEGYRVYIARDNREDSYSLAASFDKRNFDKYTFIDERFDVPRFQIVDDPFTLEELRCLYGNKPDPCADSAFDPLLYTYHNPYVHPGFPDSVFYFVAHDYNTSDLGVATPIRKVYPDVPEPDLDRPLPPEQLTEEGLPKYYEYECIIEDLLPNVPYWVSVTSFDFGSPSTGLQPLETAKSLTATPAYPNNEWDDQPDKVENVYVFPNPYRHDGWYRQLGYEGRGQEDRSRDRVRRITFANLPAKCRISIFTLDGDLIKEMEHDVDPSDPNVAYHEWDMVTRNVQMIVSGLYYWVVEDDQGNSQIGKLVVLF